MEKQNGKFFNLQFFLQFSSKSSEFLFKSLLSNEESMYF